MTNVYFLDGLGSNEHYISPLKRALAEQGIHLIYLALPGHPDNLTCQVETDSDLSAWFDGQVTDDKAVVMAFSLGADLATVLTTKSQKIDRLILLDGAVTDLSAYPIEKELEAARQHIEMMVVDNLETYIAEQASQATTWTSDLEKAERASFVKTEDGHYCLNLNKETVLNLLSIRHKAGLILTQDSYQTPTLVILAEKPEHLLPEKQAILSRTSKEYVSSLVLKDNSHHLYLEAPDKIALATRFFLDAF